MKIEFRSQRREMLLFLTTNMAAVTSRLNQQYLFILLKHLITDSKELCHEIYQNSNCGNRCQFEWNIKITVQNVKRGYKWQNKYKRKHRRKNSKKIETNSNCSFWKLVGLSSVLVVSNNCLINAWETYFVWQINLGFWEIAHLLFPYSNVNTYFSRRAKCWLKGGVGGQFPRNLN